MAVASNPLQFVSILNQPVVEPSVSSLWTFDESSQQRFVTTNDVILLSAFEGGTPGVLTPYIDLRDLQLTVDPENLGILGSALASYLKTPSFDINRRGAYRIFVIRLGAPTQASLYLQSSVPANVILLTSVDYGSYVNKLSAEVASGSIMGKKVTLRFRQETLLLDNLQNAFHLAYTGNGSAATMTITRSGDIATRLQTTLTSPTDGSINLDLDLTQDAFSTIQQLATYLNGQNGYRASIDPYANPLLPSSELDSVSAQTIRTPIALVIRYVGAGSACTMTTTNTALTTAVTGASDNLNIDLTAASTDTLGELVAYIDGLAAYTCTLGTNADPNASCTALLTNVTAQDVRTTAYSLTAQAGKMDYVSQAGLGSIIYAINTNSARVHAARVAGATAVPANSAQTFFSGGTNPTPVLSDWLDALDVVTQEDLAGAFVFPVTTDPVTQDAVLAWVGEQRTNAGNAMRVFFGTAVNISDNDVLSLALGQNSSYATTVFQGGIGPDGVSQLPPLYTAAMVCGAAAGALSTQPITRMTLRYRGLTRKYSKAIREQRFESNGLCTLTEEKGTGVILALAITTSLSQDRIDRMLSESVARDIIEQRVRAYVKPILPRWAMMNLMPTIQGQVLAALASLQAEGVLTTGIDAQNRLLPAHRPPQISLKAGLLRILLHVLIGGEIDHIDVAGTIGYQSFELTINAAA